jgi:hypothetical protein
LKIKEENGGTNVETITFDTSLQQDVWNTILIKRYGSCIWIFFYKNKYHLTPLSVDSPAKDMMS